MDKKNVIEINPEIHKDWKIFVLSSILVLSFALMLNEFLRGNPKISNEIVSLIGDSAFWPSNYLYRPEISPFFTNDEITYIFATDQIASILWLFWSSIMIVKESLNKFSAGYSTPFFPLLLLTAMAGIITVIPFNAKGSFFGLSIKNSARSNSVKITILQFFFFFLIVFSFKVLMPYLRGLCNSKVHRGEQDVK